MDLLDVALDIAKDHSSNWKKIDEYFDGPEAAGRTDVRRICDE